MHCDCGNYLNGLYDGYNTDLLLFLGLGFSIIQSRQITFHLMELYRIAIIKHMNLGKIENTRIC